MFLVNISAFYISSIIIPEITPIANNVETIIMFSLRFLFILNNTITPNPEFTHTYHITYKKFC